MRQTYPHTDAIYLLRSCKGTREFAGTYTEARAAARDWQAEIQAAYGVTVERKDSDGTTLYTAA